MGKIDISITRTDIASLTQLVTQISEVYFWVQGIKTELDEYISCYIYTYIHMYICV